MTQTAIDAEANEVVQNSNVRMLFRAVLKQAIEDALGRSNRNECSAAVADAVKTSGVERAAARAFLTAKGKRNEEDLAFICDLAGVEVGYLKRKARELWKM